MMPYLAFIMAVSLSSFVSFMMKSAALSRVAIMSLPLGSDFAKFLCFGVFFKQLDREEACGVFVPDLLVLLYFHLHLVYRLLYVVGRG